MVACLALVLLLCTGIHGEYEAKPRSQLVLSAEPNVIELGLTKSLLLNCSLDGSKKDQIISMTISKKKGPDTTEIGGEIASISTITNQVSKFNPNMEVTASGDLSQNSSGSLSLEWKSPSEGVQGSYVCQAILFKENVGTSNMTAQTKVTYKTPGLSDVLRRLDLLESSMEKGNERIQSSMKKENERMQSSMKAINQENRCFQATMKFENERIEATMKTALEEIRRTQSIIMTAVEENGKNISKLHQYASFQATSSFWVSTPFNGRRYFFSHNRLITVAKAQKTCEALGGYLVEIDSKDEFDFVESFIMSYPNAALRRNMWVIFGGTDRAKKGEWRNMHSGTPVGYIKWYTRQPDGGSCLGYWTKYPPMHDFSCYWSNRHYRFLCEVPN